MTPAPAPTGRPHVRQRREYLRRFLTLWVAEEPDPVYSWLDRCDGLTRVNRSVGYRIEETPTGT
jgi:hypothetical protein